MEIFRKSGLLGVIFLGLCLSGCGVPNSINGDLQAPTFEFPQTAKFSTKTPNPMIGKKIVDLGTPLNQLVQTAPPSVKTTLANPGSNECKKIVFVLADGTNSNIYNICPDGSQLTQLTQPADTDTFPAWSPDGIKIAFASSRSGNNQVYIMNGDGSNPTQTTSDLTNDFPVWLPDSTQIAFRTTDTKGLWWWRVINIKTNEITAFSKPSYDFFYQTPAWAPDGQNIAYMSMVEQKMRNDGSSQIHIKGVDGSNDLALTQDTWANIHPVWSPNSQRIAFLSERDGTYNVFALYVMDKDGSKLQKLTEPTYPENSTFCWSPDGQQIAIGSEPPMSNIELIDIKTRKIRKLVNLQEGKWSFSPSWQP